METKNSTYLILTIILLILSGVGGYFLFQNLSAKSATYNTDTVPKIELIPTDTLDEPEVSTSSSITTTPITTSTISTKNNILKFSDIQITFPENWKVISSTDNTAKILTDYKKYQVYLTLKLERNTTNTTDGYKEGKDGSTITKTQYGEVYSVSSGGGAGLTGAALNNNKYLFGWEIESNQKVPSDLDGVWVPESNITQKSLLDITKTVQPSSKTITSATTPTKIATATPTKKLTPTAIPTANKLSLIDYSSEDDGFSISYSSKRKLYQDTEVSGNRYTFSSTAGNFAIHVGLNNKWAWSNTDREFSNSLLVSGQPTFRYDIATQTIIDLQSNDKNYTIQCIHNGSAAAKSECEDFISSFKLL